VQSESGLWESGRVGTFRFSCLVAGSMNLQSASPTIAKPALFKNLVPYRQSDRCSAVEHDAEHEVADQDGGEGAEYASD
jgi:hypothetical protein